MSAEETEDLINLLERLEKATPKNDLTKATRARCDAWITILRNDLKSAGDSATNRLERVGYLSVDGATDCRAAIQVMITVAGEVRLTAGTYRVDGPLFVPIGKPQ